MSNDVKAGDGALRMNVYLVLDYLDQIRMQDGGTDLVTASQVCRLLRTREQLPPGTEIGEVQSMLDRLRVNSEREVGLGGTGDSE